MKYFVFLLLMLAPIQVDGFQFTEKSRFKARFTNLIEYDPVTCTLWLAGKASHISRIGLNGTRVSTITPGTAGGRSGLVGLISARAGKLLHMSRSGQVREIDRFGNTVVLDARRPINWRQKKAIGGTIFSNGTRLIAFEGDPYLSLYSPNGGLLRRSNAENSGHFADAEYDPISESVFAILKHTDADFLVILDKELNQVAQINLASWGQDARGVAIQRETGDIFIAFLQTGSVVGDVVLLSEVSQDNSAIERPPYECSTS